MTGLGDEIIYARKQTTKGNWSQFTEDNYIRGKLTEFWLEQFHLLSVGQTIIDGDYPTIFAPLGAEVELSFQFVDPTTGLVTAGPGISRVDYTANLDPDTPDIFVPIGTSTSAASNFSLDYTVAGSEPWVIATPYDLNGNPITILGLDNDNVAVGYGVILIPEPGVLTLVAFGVLLVAARKGRLRPQQ